MHGLTSLPLGMPLLYRHRLKQGHGHPGSEADIAPTMEPPYLQLTAVTVHLSGSA